MIPFTSTTFRFPDLVAPSAWVEHVPFMFWLVDALRPRRFVELGTHTGVSYCAACQAIELLHLSCSSYAIDTWKGDEHAGFYGEEIYSALAAYHAQKYAAFSSLVRSTFDEAVSHFEDESIDLLHIDGLHSYEAVRHDFETWRPKLTQNAIVLFHDTNVRERDFGVFRFWNEVSAGRPHFEFLHGHGLGVLALGDSYPEAVKALLTASKQESATEAIRTAFAHLGQAVAQGENAARSATEAETNRKEWRRQVDQRDNEIVALKTEHDKVRAVAQALELANANLAAKNNEIAALEQRVARALELADTNLAARDNSIAMLERQVQDRDHQMIALKREMELVRISRVWRYRSLLRRLASFPGRMAFYLGRPIVPRALYHLESVTSGKQATEWTVTGDDPQLELLWPGSLTLAPGYYRLTLRGPADAEAFADTRLYVDSGRGYNEVERIDLRFHSNGGGLAETIFPLYAEVTKLRFDPSDRSRQIVIDHARLRKVGRLEYYARLIARLALRHVKSPSALGRSAKRAANILRDGGLSGFAATLRSAEARGALGSITYEGWIALNDTPTEDDIANLRRRLAELKARPLISVLMPVYNTPDGLLREAIESVRAQIYQNWELCIADDCSTKPHMRLILNDYAKRDPRIKIVFREENGHISQASNSALELVTGEWVAMLDHDDELRPHALAEVALELDRHPDSELIYSDEDKIDSQGRRYDPNFKPDFSRELFRSQNYLNHLTVHRAENIRAVGGWRPGFEGSQDYDLNLRIFERIDPRKIRHIPKVLYHWRAVEGSTALDGSQKSYAYTAGLRALEEHVERMRLPARVEEAPGTTCYRLRFSVPDPQPLVSLVIPTRDKVDLLRNCLNSIREKTTYGSYEIIVVDNGSVEQETLAYFSELKKAKNMRVLHYDKPFNYSAINNFAVLNAKGSIIGLINNDIEVISPDWLTEMVSWAVQPDIGCVGAKLYYADDTIQHGGVIVGVGGVAGHSHKNFPRHHAGYFARLKVLQNLSAVTAACLLIRKNVFEEVGGLNEVDLTVAFNDVDLCLKAQEAGYSNVWTPYAELYHLESVSRGAEDAPEKVERFKNEIMFMQRQWKKVIDRDPFYSPNLTKGRDDFSLG
ncbi:MAG: glycosyltransferase [Mesorhizobium sp.]|nr:MAG: glycosyltransferase [Mesorhizobium sp.]